MLKRRSMLCVPMCALAMSGYASQPPVASHQPVATVCPVLAPELMEPEQPNLTDRLLTLFSG
jgi:hypothetical protein